MAKRPVFAVLGNPPFVCRQDVEFHYVSGFDVSQRRKCAQSLHEAWKKGSAGRVLEVSGASGSPLGRSLSAFSLMLTSDNGRRCSVECVFQGSKCFEMGGPYTDLYCKTSKEAKTDPRLKTSGRLVKFRAGGVDFPLAPPTYFYDWLYVNALYRNPAFHVELLEYDAFTDIYFNPERQINCQAEACAIFVGLYRSGLLEDALKDRESFLRIVFGQ